MWISSSPCVIVSESEVQQPLPPLPVSQDVSELAICAAYIKNLKLSSQIWN
jgi:hypothetical protein